MNFNIPKNSYGFKSEDYIFKSVFQGSFKKDIFAKFNDPLLSCPHWKFACSQRLFCFFYRKLHIRYAYPIRQNSKTRLVNPLLTLNINFDDLLKGPFTHSN